MTDGLPPPPPQAPQAPAPADLAKKPATRRPLVVGAVMLATFMVAIEATIISTAMPQIVGDLGGLTAFSWAFSGYLLAQTVATVIFGKLSDLYGRKSTMLVGIGFFLVGSLLCGFAWSMTSLIVFRLIQGIGAGAVQPIALTVVGDLFRADERGRVQGFLASIWAVSAVLGPNVGAFIIENASWAWVFWINIPLGIVAAIGFVLFLHEEVARSDGRSDIAGAAIFTVAVSALMVGLNEAGRGETAYAWLSAAVFVASTAAFVWRERVASHPMIAIELWSRRAIAACNGAMLLCGGALIGLTMLLPIFVQGVLRQSPLIAGLTLTAVMFGWPVGSTVASRLFQRVPLRVVVIVGSGFTLAGALAFPLLGPGSSPILAGCGSFIMGVGFGLLNLGAIVMVQEIVPWSERGTATASLVFSRNLGSTLGAALFGAILNHGLAGSGATVTSDDLQRMLDVGGGSGIEVLRDSLDSALHLTFLAVLAIAALTVAVSVFVPHVRLGRRAA